MGITSDRPSDVDGDKIIIEGGTDGTEVGNVGDRLKVTGNPSPSDANGCPTYSNNYKIVSDFTNNNISSSNTTVYSYSGTGKFESFHLRFNTQDMSVILTIDGNEMFDVQLDDLDELGDGQDSFGAVLRNTRDDKTILFKPNCPIYFDTSVLLEARADSGTKQLKQYIISVVEET